MNDYPTLCPACLVELPEDYPYDHVLIDRALSGGPELFRTMGRQERQEVIRTGRARGLSNTAISIRLGCTVTHVRRTMGDWPAKYLDARVTELWSQELPDSVISMRVGCHHGTVAKVRKRLGLPSLYGPGGRRKTIEVAA